MSSVLGNPVAACHAQKSPEQEAQSVCRVPQSLGAVAARRQAASDSLFRRSPGMVEGGQCPFGD